MFFGKKKLQARIIELEQRLAESQSVEENLQSNMLYFSLDQNGAITNANSLFLKSTEYTLEELKGLSLSDMLPASKDNKKNVEGVTEVLNDHVAEYRTIPQDKHTIGFLTDLGSACEDCLACAPGSIEDMPRPAI